MTQNDLISILLVILSVTFLATSVFCIYSRYSWARPVIAVTGVLILLRILWRYLAESGELWVMILSLVAALFVILLLWYFSGSEEPPSNTRDPQTK